MLSTGQNIVQETWICELSMLDNWNIVDMTFADDDLKFYENGEVFSKRVDNAVRKREIALYKQFLIFS